MWDIVFALLKDGLLAAAAAVGFSVISDPPRRTISSAALLAAIGHATRYSMQYFADADLLIASFTGALVIGFCCIGFSSWLHCPTTVLCIPALLPMIPGIYAYKTIFAITQFIHNAGDSTHAMHYMLEVFSNGIITFSTVFALVVGVTIPTLLLKKWSFQMTRQKK